MIDIKVPEKNYLVLEMHSKDREAGSLNLEFIYILEFAKEKIVLVRQRSLTHREEEDHVILGLRTSRSQGIIRYLVLRMVVFT